MVNVEALSDALNRCVHPLTYPLALRLCVSSDEIPEGAKRPKRDFGKQMLVCQALAIARRLGDIMALGLEDGQCPIANLALGFVPPKKAFVDGSFGLISLTSLQADMVYYGAMKFLEHGKYKYLLVAPIDKTTFEPHFIVVYGNPAQVERMVQARLYLTGGVLTSLASLGIECSFIFGETLLNDECQVILLGQGSRSHAHDQDHEMMFTIPASKIDLMLQGFEASEKSNYRLPTPVDMDYEVVQGPSYRRLQEFLTKEGS